MATKKYLLGGRSVWILKERRSLDEIFAEARAEVAAWPESLRELSRFRLDELRKLEQPPSAPASHRRSLQEVIDEARAEMSQWPESLKQQNRFRNDELRAHRESEASATQPHGRPSRG